MGLAAAPMNTAEAALQADAGRRQLDRDRVCRARRQFRRGVAGLLVAADVLALALAFAIGNVVVYGTEDFAQLGTVLAAALPLQLMFGLNGGAYDAGTGVRAPASVTQGLTAMALTGAALVLLVFLLKAGPEFSRLQFIIGGTLGCAGIASLRFAIARLCAPHAAQGLFAAVHIYDGIAMPLDRPGALLIDAASAGLSPDRNDLRAVNRIGVIAKGMDSVVVHCLPADRLRWANALKALDVPGEIVVPELDALGALSVSRREGQTSLRLGSGQLRWDQQVLKRAFDLVIALGALPLLALLFVVVAIAIKLDSRGPVFFCQERIGIGNRRFRMWKFRSMHVDQEDSLALRLTLRADPRVTRVGAFLRRSSLDELPQMLNVLTGDMSLVGPRPHAPMAKAGNLLYWEVDQAYWDRHVVKPGITGLAQVRGHRGNTFASGHLRNRLQADLEYVESWSLLLDIRILIATLAVPFHKNAF